MPVPSIIAEIRQLIAFDQLDTALQQLQAVFEETPRLNEILQQSGRWNDIRQQIRLGTVSHADATLTKNQIRAALLELVAEIEERAEQSQNVHRELEKAAVTITNSKNVVHNATISAGGNIHIGDNTTNVTESETSRKLRLFLYVSVPLLAIGAAYFWYQYQKAQTPQTLTVDVAYRATNPDLAFKGGTVTLKYANTSHTDTLQQSVDFKGIPASCSSANLHFEADGFLPIDTTLSLPLERLTLPLRHDNSLAKVAGQIYGYTGSFAELSVRVQDLTAPVQPDGSFAIAIPVEKQRNTQRVQVLKQGRIVWDYEQPIFAEEPIQISLSQ